PSASRRRLRPFPPRRSSDLFTAARLAERRDVHVEFGVSAYGGTRATVLLPDRILENPEPEQDQPEPEPVPAMPRQREHGWSGQVDRKSTRLNSSHVKISYAV